MDTSRIVCITPPLRLYPQHIVAVATIWRRGDTGWRRCQRYELTLPRLRRLLSVLRGYREEVDIDALYHGQFNVEFDATRTR